MKRIKVMTVVGTRPEIIRLSRVIAALDSRTDHILVHTGQNYDHELSDIFFKDLGLRKPAHFLKAVGPTAVATIGNILNAIDPLIAQEKPDAFLVLGDTNSCLSAIAAKRAKVPIFHMEAGNRCFDQRVPEESNRRLVDHLSDINMPYSDIAREYLLREGLPPDRVIKTGSPMFEVLAHYARKIAASRILKSLKLKRGDYFVVSCHREENVDSPKQLALLVDSLNLIAKQFSKRIIFSTHPRTRKRLEGSGARLSSKVELLKPLGFPDFVHLQEHSKAVLSDSGTISEESSILGFPAVNIREAHERPEGIEEAAVMMTGLKPERILQALSIMESEKALRAEPGRKVADYSMPDVSRKVVRIICSYIDYVNRVVWQKN